MSERKKEQKNEGCLEEEKTGDLVGCLTDFPVVFSKKHVNSAYAVAMLKFTCSYVIKTRVDI